MIVWSQSGYYAEPPTGLSDFYFRQGYGLAAGLGYVTGDDDANVFLKDLQERVSARDLIATPETVRFDGTGMYPTAVHPPGMAILVAGFHRLMGIPSDLPIQVFGAVLDSVAAGLVFWIGCTVASPAVGLVAGILYAVFLPQAWAATGAQMPDGLIGPFIVAMLAAYLKAVHSAGPRAYAWYLIAGLALGLGSYMRPDYLLAPIAMFPFVWRYLRRLKQAAAGSALVLIVALATLSPWAYRNHVVFGQWIFTAVGAGPILITSLAEFSNPWGFGPTDDDRQQEAVTWGLRSAWMPEAVPHFQRLWWEAVRSHPAAFVLTMVKRAPIALAPPHQFGFENPLKTRTFTDLRATGQDRYQVLLNDPLYVLGAYWDTLLMAAFSGLALLASVWWLIVERRRAALVLLVLSPHIYSIAVHMIVHLEPRYLLPSMFVLLVGLGFVVVHPPHFRMVRSCTTSP